MLSQNPRIRKSSWISKVSKLNLDLKILKQTFRLSTTKKCRWMFETNKKMSSPIFVTIFKKGNLEICLQKFVG